MFSAELLQIAREVLLVGGAVCMILLLFVFLYVLVVLNKISRTVGAVKQTVTYAMSIAQLPMVLLQKLLDKVDDF